MSYRLKAIEGIREEACRDDVKEKDLVLEMRRCCEFAGVLAEDYDEVGDVEKNLEAVMNEARLAADLAQRLLAIRRERNV